MKLHKICDSFNIASHNIEKLFLCCVMRCCVSD